MRIVKKKEDVIVKDWLSAGILWGEAVGGI